MSYRLFFSKNKRKISLWHKYELIMQNLTKKQKTRTPRNIGAAGHHTHKSNKNYCPSCQKIRTFRHHAYVKYVQHRDNSLNSYPNLDEAALCAMKRCIAPWSMPTAYEALRSNISGGVKHMCSTGTYCTPEISLNSCPNLDEAALCAMKRCIAPWSMPTAYEALRSNISGGII